MVTNAPPEYYAAKKKFEEARTPEEKLLALQEMLRYAPKHKGAQNLIGWINKEISKYKKIIEKNKRKGKGGIRIIDKSGDILISIIGIENSGKSYFLKKFTNANVEVSELPFSTTYPAIGTIFKDCVYYQFVEIPSNFDSRYRSILSLSDYFIVILSKNYDIYEQLSRINEFCKGIIEFNMAEGSNYDIILNDFTDFKDINIDSLLEKIIKKLKLIRVKPIDNDHCVLLSENNSTIKDFIEKINKKWLEKFVYAKVYRNNTIIKVGLNFKLKDKDTVEIKIKL